MEEVVAHALRFQSPSRQTMVYASFCTCGPHHGPRTDPGFWLSFTSAFLSSGQCHHTSICHAARKRDAAACEQPIRKSLCLCGAYDSRRHARTQPAKQDG